MISSAVRKRYDIVGFDPRGVGRSDPVECLTDRQTDQFLAADPTPTTPAQIAEAVALAKGFVAGCQQRSGPELEFVGTRDAARDMDVLRSALGDPKLYYLGKSYGTFLGATYADEFPTHVGRMVLDGVIDPALTSEEVNRGQAQGFELATRSFLADCVRRSSCPLGHDVTTAEQRLRDLLTSLDARPLPTKDPARPLTEGWGSLGVALPLYNKSYWPLLRAALTQAEGGSGAALLTLADAYADRSSSGRYGDNSNDAIYAVNCQDRSQPGGVAGIAAGRADLPVPSRRRGGRCSPGARWSACTGRTRRPTTRIRSPLRAAGRSSSSARSATRPRRTSGRSRCPRSCRTATC